MNANRLPGYAFFLCSLVIPLVIGMLIPATPSPPAFIFPTADPYRQTNGYPGNIESPAKSALASDVIASPPHSVELKLDHLPRTINRENTAVSEIIAASVPMKLDDGQLETAYGLNDDTYAYQFIWFNRFTPQTSDFPFSLNEIWVMFDDTVIDANINVGDAIDLVVYSDADSNPSNGATWLATYNVEILAVDGGTWSTYNLSPPLTLADPGDVLIGVINRQVISGFTGPSYPAGIDTTTSQERSWIGWWSFDPPDPAELPADDTLALIAGDNAGNWLIRGYGGSPTANIYLPLVLKDAGLPSIPTLYDIDNADGDGSYTINWSMSSLAASYTLQEDDNPDFSSPSVIYNGSATTKAIVGQALGNYYYRVRAENWMGYSGWSAVKMVAVTQVPQFICETHNFGTVGVSLQVLPSGSFDHFTAENNMLVETVEVKASLKASQFATDVYIAVGINEEQLFNTTQHIWNFAYLPYTINRNVAHELHVGDDIFFYITRSFSDPVAYIGWGNYVKLCGR